MKQAEKNGTSQAAEAPSFVGGSSKETLDTCVSVLALLEKVVDEISIDKVDQEGMYCILRAVRGALLIEQNRSL